MADPCLLLGGLLFQQAMSATGCFSVDKEETTIYKRSAFQPAIMHLLPNAMLRTDAISLAL